MSLRAPLSTCSLSTLRLLFLLGLLGHPRHDDVEDTLALLELRGVQLLIAPQSPRVLARLRREDQRFAVFRGDKAAQSFLSDSLTLGIVLNGVWIGVTWPVRCLLQCRACGTAHSLLSRLSVRPLTQNF